MTPNCKHGQRLRGILPQGKGLRNLRKLRKIAAIYKTHKLLLYEKSLTLARKKYFTQNVAALNLFSLNNQLHVRYF